MGEDRMSKQPPSVDHLSELNWHLHLEKVKRQFASTAVLVPKKDSKLTKQGWYRAWRNMVSLCARALQYKHEAEQRVRKLEDKLQTEIDNAVKITEKYEVMVKSFDELGEKYTKDMDALMKLLILLGRKIDE